MNWTCWRWLAPLERVCSALCSGQHSSSQCTPPSRDCKWELAGRSPPSWSHSSPQPVHSVQLWEHKLGTHTRQHHRHTILSLSNDLRRFLSTGAQHWAMLDSKHQTTYHVSLHGCPDIYWLTRFAELELIQDGYVNETSALIVNTSRLLIYCASAPLPFLVATWDRHIFEGGVYSGKQGMWNHKKYRVRVII